MIENNVLEALVLRLVESIEKLVSNGWACDNALKTVFCSDVVRDYNFTSEELDRVDTKVRVLYLHRSMEKAQSTPHSGTARSFIGGRIPPRSGRARFSGRDLAAGAEAEERRDEVASMIPPLRES